MIHFDEMACLLYLEGQLEPARAREMALHAGECADCRTLLHALERESHVLSAALTEDNEAMPARLLSTRSWGVPSWVWTLAFGVFAFGAYWLWADSVDPWLQRLSNAGFGGTVFQILRRFYGTDDIAFTFVSDEFNGITRGSDGNVRPLLPRSFSSLSEAEEENGQSRIYLGIHWKFDKTESITLGRRVGDYVFDNVFVPLHPHTR